MRVCPTLLTKGRENGAETPTNGKRTCLTGVKRDPRFGQDLALGHGNTASRQEGFVLAANALALPVPGGEEIGGALFTCSKQCICKVHIGGGGLGLAGLAGNEPVASGPCPSLEPILSSSMTGPSPHKMHLTPHHKHNAAEKHTGLSLLSPTLTAS